MESTRSDVLIVGAGVVGLSCALALLDRGRQVTVLEAGEVGQGSSHGNCGTITPSHAAPLAGPGMIGQALRWMVRPDAPLYVKPRWDPALASWLCRFAGRCNRRDWMHTALAKGALLRSSREHLQRWISEHALDCEFQTLGLTYVYRDADSLARFLPELQPLAELGIAAEVLDAAVLQRDEPALREGVAGGVFFPGDASLRPDRLVSSLAARIRQQGGELRTGEKVTGFAGGKGGVDIDTAGGGRLAARQVIVATGAWTPALTRSLGLRVPIQPGKGYSITYDRPSLTPRNPLVLKERSVCVTAWDSGFRLGSTMEFSGYDSSLNRRRLDALVRGAREYLREPEGPRRREEWYGWRPMTWDDLPLIGPVPRQPGLFLAAGHGMMGVSMSTATALLVAGHVDGAEMPLDPTPYLPERFG